jgi:nicotinamidase/pyrazinamidase
MVPPESEDGDRRLMARIGWIVDCQRDFMEPDGRLYVRNLFDDSDPGAIQIVDKLCVAVEWMRANCDVLVFTGDWHGYDDAEIDTENPNPDAGTYPPHCMGRSDDAEERAGAEIIEVIRPRNPLVLEMGMSEEETVGLVAKAVKTSRDLFVRKNRFDVFRGNAAAQVLMRSLRTALGEPFEVVVIGVARDVCVAQAVDGMRSRGYHTVAVRDATWGLGLETEAETLARWEEGGEVVTLAELDDRV